MNHHSFVLIKHPKLTIIITLFISILGFMSMDIFFPSLPAISKSFGINDDLTQLCVATYLTSLGLSQLIYGPLSDYYGRRLLLLIGLAIYLYGSVLAFTTSSFSILILGRLLQGLGIGSGATLSRAILRDLSSGNKMAQLYSFLATGIIITAAIAPGIGGIIQQLYGYQGNLLIMLLFGTFVFILLIFFLPETNIKRITRKIEIRNILLYYRQILSNKCFITYIIYTSLSFSILIAYSSINPFILQNTYHLEASHYGLLAIVIASGELFGTIINGLIVNRFGFDRMIFIGFVILAISGIGLMLHKPLGLSAISHIVIFCFLATVGIAFIFPNAAAGAFSIFNENIGIVGALYGSIQILFATITSYLISLLHINSTQELASMIIIAAIIGLYVKFLNSKR